MKHIVVIYVFQLSFVFKSILVGLKFYRKVWIILTETGDTDSIEKGAV